MIVMKPTATEEDDPGRHRAHRERRRPRPPLARRGGDRDRRDRRPRARARLGLEGHPGVEQVVPILKPYKLASSQFRHGERTVDRDRRAKDRRRPLRADRRAVHGRVARADARSTAHAVADGGATMFRGGAYKPRTSPYSFQGLGQEGLRLLAEAKEQTGLPIVTELMDARDLEPMLEVADVIQIGARNMQNYPLLTEVGRAGLPGADQARAVVDARGAADGGGVRAQGGQRERDAVRARHPHVRDRLPLHARHHGDPGAQGALAPAGDRRPQPRAGPARLVLPLSLAAAAAGADGIIVEVHPNPEEAICDGPQADLQPTRSPTTLRAGRARRGGRRQGPVTRRAREGRGRRRRADRRLDRPGRAPSASARERARLRPVGARHASARDRPRRDREACESVAGAVDGADDRVRRRAGGRAAGSTLSTRSLAAAPPRLRR